MSRAADLGRRLVALRWFLFDAAVAMVLVTATIDQHYKEPVHWWIFTVAMVAALLVRRQRPVLAVCLATTGAVAHHLDPAVPLELLDLAVPLTLYTLASSDRSRRSSAGVLAGVLGCVALLSLLYLVSRSAEPEPDRSVAVDWSAEKAALAKLELAGPGGAVTPADALARKPPRTVTAEVEPDSVGDLVAAALGQALGVMLLLGLAFAVGDNVRRRRAHLRTLETRAADLEREQRQRVALATAAERARITRELHDVVAHGLSVMVVQAQGGAAALRRHPDRTAVALDNVITTGRESLGEMRRLLDLVRHDPADDAQLAPQPGVEALPDLIDRVRAAGTPVTFVLDGEPAPLPVSVDLSAYRIAQEALTNTLKHGGSGASATVRLGFRPDAVKIEVTDDGAGGPVPPRATGNGLRGIDERVRMLGGELTSGPTGTGGFQVRAVLPLRPDGPPVSEAVT